MSDFVSPEIGQVYHARQDGRPLDRARLAEATSIETSRFVETHPRSARAFEDARRTLRTGVPMDWMVKWAGPFPIFVQSAHGTVVRDIDGNDYVDFCLGDTGAMAGHAPEAVAARLSQQLVGGLTTMLPTTDAVVAGELLAERFGLPLWEFATTATDANRAVVRHARRLTGRTKVCVFNWCYHGMLDETLVRAASDGSVASRVDGAGIDVRATTKVVEFNDLEGLERALRPGDVACVLTEPALTNVGIVLPEPGFHEGLRELTRATGTLLAIDETHTLCCGPGGFTGAHGLTPDFLTVGKAIGGGFPVATWGTRHDIAEAMEPSHKLQALELTGTGSTLSGSQLAVAAVRATLENLLSDTDFDRMRYLAGRFGDAVVNVASSAGLNWSATALGGRVEYAFGPPARNGQSAVDATDPALEEFLHLWALNRGVLMTPFHNMALMSPATTERDVDVHTRVFEDAVAALTG
jgi:glutamate-1-semialdehyde aminotransferase